MSPPRDSPSPGPHRPALLALGGACLLLGLDGGLLRAGLPAPLTEPMLHDAHGVVMVLGFLGAVIALERAVACREPWSFAAPALLGLGGLSLALPAASGIGAVLLLGGCVALVGVDVALWRRAAETIMLVQMLGAVGATCAALLWPRLGADQVVALLVAFLVTTIAAERVELAVLALPRSAGSVAAGGAAALLAAALADVLDPAHGGRAFGVVLVVGTAWLLTHDIARRTIRGRGLPRFSAAGMLLGYAWLLLGGLTWAAYGRPAPGTWAYDLAVHAVFLGFAMSMVLAHAPIILPAVLRRPLPYRPWLYLPLAVLHGALLLRVSSGVLSGRGPAWQAGAAASVAALLLIPAVLAAGVLTTSGPRAPTRKVPTR